MGAGNIVAVVADAGPLIHLAEIDALSFLRIFAPLHVPDAVWDETVGRGRLLEDELLEIDVVQRHELLQADVDQWIQRENLEHLHKGELESLFLCQIIAVPIVLTDDLAVRDAAKRLSLTPVGSLGVVLKAYRDGLISHSDAERHFRDLQDVSSLFITNVIVELALERLRLFVG